jgi:Flp pilus assembly protein TadB
MEPHDQKFYDIVAGEIRSRFVVDGLWVRAFSDADGDEAKAKAVYITRRVEQLKAEAQAAKSAAFDRAQAEARDNQEQRNRLKREQRSMRAGERQAERQRPIDPKGKKLIMLLIIFAISFFILTVL